MIDSTLLKIERNVVNLENFERIIERKALELGYERCGIISVDEMAEFADRLRERIEKVPENEDFYNHFFGFAQLQKEYPWAQSLIVCVVKYTHYQIPEHLDGLIGKHYLTDVRSNEECKEHSASINFESFLNEQGLKVETNRRFGISAMRMSAVKAGLGIIRKNNFFYSDSGSWVHIEAFLVDRKMELIQVGAWEPCPDSCHLCIEACPTESLMSPFTMSPAKCISPITVVPNVDLTTDPHREKLGQWIYGCDICQDACPFNNGKWEHYEEFPGLKELAAKITLESIVEMDESTLINLLADKFFYIEKERIWRWKVNALNAMLNKFDKKYTDVIKNATNDSNEEVSRMAKFVAGKLSIA